MGECIFLEVMLVGRVDNLTKGGVPSFACEGDHVEKRPCVVKIGESCAHGDLVSGRVDKSVIFCEGNVKQVGAKGFGRRSGRSKTLKRPLTAHLPPNIDY